MVNNEDVTMQDISIEGRTVLNFCVDTAKKNNGSMIGKVDILFRYCDKIDMDKEKIEKHMVKLVEKGHLHTYYDDSTHYYTVQGKLAKERFTNSQSDNLNADILLLMGAELHRAKLPNQKSIQDVVAESIAFESLRVGMLYNKRIFKLMMQFESAEDFNYLANDLIKRAK